MTHTFVSVLPAQFPVQCREEVRAVIIVGLLVAVVGDAHLQFVAQVGDVLEEGGAGQAHLACELPRRARVADVDEVVDVDDFLQVDMYHGRMFFRLDLGYFRKKPHT